MGNYLLDSEITSRLPSCSQKKTNFETWADQPEHDMSTILSTFFYYIHLLLKLHHPNCQVSKCLQIYRPPGQKNHPYDTCKLYIGVTGMSIGF